MPLAIVNLFNTPAPDDMSNKKRLMRDTLIEFLATTVFVWAGTLSAVATGDALSGRGNKEDVARILPIAFSFGVSILALVYAMGHLTGGCMNPGGESFKGGQRVYVTLFQNDWSKDTCSDTAMLVPPLLCRQNSRPHALLSS
jgi:hypothetical protein